MNNDGLTPNEITNAPKNKVYLDANNRTAFLILALFPISGALGFHNLILRNGKRRFIRHMIIDAIFLFFYFLSFEQSLRRERFLSDGEFLEALIILIAIISYIVAAIDGFRFLTKKNCIVSAVKNESNVAEQISAIRKIFSYFLFASAITVDIVAINIIFRNVIDRESIYTIANIISIPLSLIALAPLVKNTSMFLSDNENIIKKHKTTLIAAFDIVNTLNILGLTFWILTFQFNLA